MPVSVVCMPVFGPCLASCKTRDLPRQICSGPAWWRPSSPIATTSAPLGAHPVPLRLLYAIHSITLHGFQYKQRFRLQSARVGARYLLRWLPGERNPGPARAPFVPNLLQSHWCLRGPFTAALHTPERARTARPCESLHLPDLIAIPFVACRQSSCLRGLSYYTQTDGEAVQHRVSSGTGSPRRGLRPA